MDHTTLSISLSLAATSSNSLGIQYTKLYISPVSKADITAEGMQLLIGSANICFQINKQQQIG